MVEAVVGRKTQTGMARSVSKLAAIVLDNWKLPIFKRHLDAAGYKYEEPVRFTAGTSTLKVRYEWVHELKPVIEAAANECAEMKL